MGYFNVTDSEDLVSVL